MRLAIVIHTFNSHRGGKEIVTWNLVDRLLDLGVRIDLITNSAEELIHPNLSVHQVPMWGKTIGLHRKSFAHHAEKKFRQLNTKLCYVNGKTGFGHVARIGGFPHVSHLAGKRDTKAGFLKLVERVRQFLNIKDHMALSLEKQTFTQPELEKIICPSNVIKRELLLQYPTLEEQQINVIPNGFSVSDYPYEKRSGLRSSFRDERGIEPNKKVMLFVGNNFELKGLPLVLQWLEDHDDWKLIVVGDDSPLPVSSKLEGRIHWEGRKEDVAPYYAAADSLVLLSKTEGFGLVVLEALSMGCFVVTSNGVGAAELLRKDWLGDRVSRQEFLSYQFPGEYLSDPDFQRRRHQFARRYSWDRMAEDYFEVLNSVNEQIIER